ncbi:anoctamin-9-like [Mustelus asterias]
MICELKAVTWAEEFIIAPIWSWFLLHCLDTYTLFFLNTGGLREFLQNRTFESVFPLHEAFLVHLDEISIFGQTFEETIERQEVVLAHLLKLNLKVKPRKCQLSRKSVKIIWNNEHVFQRKWANAKCLFGKQPINQIRLYFGERIALYFAWLGWYTTMLIPAAICGLLVFLYGMVYFGQGQVSKEICSAHTIIMCPTCDQMCPFWRLSDTCAYAKITELFDQEITLYFAMFMGIWATVFLELWKRARIKVVSDWDLFHWDEDEEELALGLIYTPDESPAKYQHSYLRTTIVLLLGGVLITIIISITLGIVIFRIVTAVILTKSSVDVMHENANSVAIIISAMLHFVIVIIMTKVNYIVARKLSQLERKRTVLARENSFTIKMFTFQFVTMFASNVYIAYFLGRINGHPGNYVRVGNKWRLEECHPSGCMTDLLIQMAVVMVLKQVLSTTVEYAIPAFKRKWRKRTRLANQSVEDVTKHWIKNYSLNEFNSYSFFNEFLEMAIQYGFTTIFVAAFPLAPLLALLNNLFEIRLDARKMIWLLKRPIPRKAKDIGIWLEILEVIGVFAIIGNGLVITITSDFIPRKVYQYSYSPCAVQKNTSIDCLTGYVNNSLSVYHLKNFDDEFFPLDDGAGLLGFTINHCRYRDYRSEHSHKHTGQFWHIFAARLACLVLFENVAVCIKYLACWFIPDVPTSVRNENLRKTYYRLRDELRGHLLPVKVTAVVNFHATQSFQAASGDVCEILQSSVHKCVREVTKALYTRAEQSIIFDLGQAQREAWAAGSSAIEMTPMHLACLMLPSTELLPLRHPTAVQRTHQRKAPRTSPVNEHRLPPHKQSADIFTMESQVSGEASGSLSGAHNTTVDVHLVEMGTSKTLGLWKSAAGKESAAGLGC